MRCGSEDFQLSRRDVEIAIQLSGFNAQTIDSLYDGKREMRSGRRKKRNIEVKVTRDFSSIGVFYWKICRTTRGKTDAHARTV
jgi:hypothetical protein